MKIGARALGGWIFLGAVGLGTLASCGSPVDGEGMKSVSGSVTFGSQCQDGTFDPGHAVELEMWNCPVEVDEFVLRKPLEPVILQADCITNVMSIRSMSGHGPAVDKSKWNFFANGNFEVTVDGGVAELEDDGLGNAGCTQPLTLHLSGRVNCPQGSGIGLTIDTEAVWFAEKYVETPRPSPSPSPLPSPTPLPSPSASPFPWPFPWPTPTPSVAPRAEVARGSCKLPPSCYLYATTRVRQCR
jgi:hypothetical protein